MIKQFLYIVFLFFCASLFVSNMIIAKIAISYGHPFLMSFFRWGLSGVFFLLLSWKDIKTHKSLLFKNIKRILLLAFLGMFICASPIYFAASYTSAINMGLILSLSPVLVFFFTTRGLKNILLQLIGLVLCFCGLLIGLLNSNTHNNSAWIGIILVICVMLAWTFYTLEQTKLKTIPPFLLLGVLSSIGALMNLPFALYEGIHFNNAFSLHNIELYLFLAIFPGIGAYTIFNLAIKNIGAYKASLMMYFTPIATIVLSVIFLAKEQFTLSIFLSLIFLMIGAYWSNKFRKS